MLILAGVTIATLFGDNGILIRANEAKEATEQAKQDEEDILSSYEDKINEYAGIDWNTALANAEKHPEQKNSTVVGVGTNGKSVNMDLWEYNFDDVTNGYGLNDTVSLTTTASADASRGYKGTDFNNIIIPQYISIDEGENWIPVTNLDWLFFNCTELEKIDILPFTVKSMRYTFRGCSKLQTVDNFPSQLENMQNTFYGCTSLVEFNANIPDNVINMSNTFNGCTSLVEFNANISNNVTNMQGTFYNCTSLKTAPRIIPSSVTNMQSTFYNCTSLKTAPKIIPSSVKNMFQTFRGCSNLTGTMEINANLNGSVVYNWNGQDYKDYEQCFTNTSTVGNGLVISKNSTCLELENLFNTKSSNSNIKIEE